MKLAMIMNGFPELSEKFLVNQVTGLIDAGIVPEVYAAVRPSSRERHSLAERYGLYESTRYAEAGRSRRDRLAGLPAAFLGSLLSSPAAAFRALDAGRYATAARNGKTLYFARAMRGMRYDIAHCHFGPNGLIGAFLKDAGIVDSLVVTFHGSDINTYPRRHGAGVYRHLYERADLVTANTAFTKARLVENGCPEGKIEILPVGLRMEEHAAPDAAARAAAPPLILTVGRLVEKKGHRHALAAFARVRERFPAAEYHIAGDGPLRGALEAQARSLGIAESVRFLGPRNDREVAELYAKASVFVLPSVTASDGDMEGQGLVLQEAQASGLPVVSTLHNGIPDGVLEGRSGFLVPEGDESALAERVMALLGDGALRESMGAEGRRFVAANYDTPRLTERLIGLYGRITHRG